MSFTNKHARQAATRLRRAPALCLIVTPFLLSLSATTHAQAANIDQDIKQLSELLQALDDQAQACLTALDAEPSTNNPPGISQCQAFMTAIDGEPVASYLAGCRQLGQWRNEYVAQHATASKTARDSNSDIRDNERELQRLIDIEFYCGEDALRLRTAHVFDAFAAVRQLQGRGLAGGRPGLSAPRGENNGTVRSMHERLRLETEQRWQQLQLDLLRQQSQQPVDYGLIQ